MEIRIKRKKFQGSCKYYCPGRQPGSPAVKMAIVLGKEAPDDLDLLLQLGGQLLQSGDILDLQPKVFSL